MRILITGGTGFIGRELCKQLHHNGHAVTVLTRNKAKSSPSMAAMRLIESLEQAGSIDAVINLAGENLADGAWSVARKQRLRDSRLGTTQKLLAWIAQLPVPPRVLISGSAIGYYGPRGDERLDESAASGSDFAAQLCRNWEAIAFQAEAFGVRVCAVRTGVVLGNNGGALKKMLLPFLLGLGGPMGDGRQWMSWVHRVDLVRLLQWLVETDSCRGVYNGTAPEPVTNREFAKSLAASLKRPALLTTPAFALKLLFGEMAGLLLTGQRVLPKRALAEGFVFRHPTLVSALGDLHR